RPHQPARAGDPGAGDSEGPPGQSGGAAHHSADARARDTLVACPVEAAPGRAAAAVRTGGDEVADARRSHGMRSGGRATGAARGQRAAALEALGDDEGAARELAELLARIGPQPALEARLAGVRDAARRAAHFSLLGAAAARVEHSPIVVSAFARVALRPPVLA